MPQAARLSVQAGLGEDLGGGGAGTAGGLKAVPSRGQFLCISLISRINNEIRMAESS